MFLSKQEELCKKLRRTKTPINMAKINLFLTPIVLTFLIKKNNSFKNITAFYIRTLTYFRNMIDKLLCNICSSHDNYSL